MLHVSPSLFCWLFAFSLFVTGDGCCTFNDCSSCISTQSILQKHCTLSRTLCEDRCYGTWCSSGIKATKNPLYDPPPTTINLTSKDLLYFLVGLLSILFVYEIYLINSIFIQALLGKLKTNSTLLIGVLLWTISSFVVYDDDDSMFSSLLSTLPDDLVMLLPEYRIPQWLRLYTWILMTILLVKQIVTSQQEEVVQTAFMALQVEEGQHVMYTKKEPHQDATVIKLHHDDTMPYYTIRLLLSGKEIQTTQKYLIGHVLKE